jgi:ubiquitin-protein ligase
MASSSAAAGLLARQLKQMQNDKSISGISCGLVDNNVFEWEVMLMIDDDTKFYGGTYSWARMVLLKADRYLGGFFRARLTFPIEYPLLPPKMRFETPIFHPNSELLQRSVKRIVSTMLTPKSSLPERRSMYIDPTSTGGRQVRVRVGSRALVTRSNTRDHPPISHLDALEPE